MLPIPTTIRASIRKVFTGARRLRARIPQGRAVERLAERFDAQVLKVPVRFQVVGEDGEHQAEASRVPQPQPLSTVQVQGHVLMAYRRRRFRHETELPTHAQMHADRPALFNFEQQVLGPAAHGDDPAPNDPSPQIVERHRLPQDRLGSLDTHDPPPHDMGLQAAAEDLHFGQFRHSRHCIAQRMSGITPGAQPSPPGTGSPATARRGSRRYRQARASSATKSASAVSAARLSPFSRSSTSSTRAGRRSSRSSGTRDAAR